MGGGGSRIGDTAGGEVVTIDWASRPTYHKHTENVANLFPNER